MEKVIVDEGKFLKVCDDILRVDEIWRAEGLDLSTPTFDKLLEDYYYLRDSFEEAGLKDTCLAPIRDFIDLCVKYHDCGGDTYSDKAFAADLAMLFYRQPTEVEFYRN